MVISWRFSASQNILAGRSNVMQRIALVECGWKASYQLHVSILNWKIQLLAVWNICAKSLDWDRAYERFDNYARFWKSWSLTDACDTCCAMLKLKWYLVFQYTVSDIGFFLVKFGKSCSEGQGARLESDVCRCKPHWALGWLRDLTSVRGYWWP